MLANYELFTERFNSSDWYSRDVDILLRKLTGEVNPQPYIEPRQYWIQAHKIGGVAMLSTLKEDAYERGNIAAQEQRLQGRNRYATTEQSTYLWVSANGLCTYCTVSVAPYELPVKGRETMHSDHKVPFTFAGKTIIENLTCACSTCNELKGMAYDTQYSQALKEYAEHYSVSLPRARFYYKRDYGTSKS